MYKMDMAISQVPPFVMMASYALPRLDLLLAQLSLSQVAGVVGRAEMLSAMFFLLSIFCYRRAVHHRKGEIMW